MLRKHHLAGVLIALSLTAGSTAVAQASGLDLVEDAVVVVEDTAQPTIDDTTVDDTTIDVIDDTTATGVVEDTTVVGENTVVEPVVETVIEEPVVDVAPVVTDAVDDTTVTGVVTDVVDNTTVTDVVTGVVDVEDTDVTEVVAGVAEVDDTTVTDAVDVENNEVLNGTSLEDVDVADADNAHNDTADVSADDTLQEIQVIGGSLVDMDGTLNDVNDGGVVNLDGSLDDVDVIDNDGTLPQDAGVVSDVVDGPLVTDVVDGGLLDNAELVEDADVLSDLIDGGALNDADIVQDVIDGDVLSGNDIDILNDAEILDGGILNDSEILNGDITAGDVLTGVVDDVTVIGGDVTVEDLVDADDVIGGDLISVIDLGSGCGCASDGGTNDGGDTNVIVDVIDSVVDIDTVLGDIITIIDVDNILGGGIINEGDTTVIDNVTTNNVTNNVTNNTVTNNVTNNTVTKNVTKHTVINYVIHRITGGTKVVHRVHHLAAERAGQVVVKRVVRLVGTSAPVHHSAAGGPVVNALPQTGSGAAEATSPAGLFALGSLLAALAGAGLRTGIIGRTVAG